MASPPQRNPITISELEAIARHKLPKQVFEYYACGADEQKCLSRNRKAFDRLLIRPRAMIDVSRVSTSTTLFGVDYPCPFAFAPSAMQKLAHPEGELCVATAARGLGLNSTLSSQSTTALEEIAEAWPASVNGPERWFQLYLATDLLSSLPLIRRAADAGYTALVLTVDTPFLGNRLNERKTPLVLPEGLSLANYTDAQASKPSPERMLLNASTSTEAREIAHATGGVLHSAALTWETTMAWLRSVTDMKVILKGIMTEEDAELAVRYGADAIVVSNHGGRQLDSSPATIEVLPSIVEAVDRRIPVLFDGGVTHGSDVFKAVALGADLVLVGRAVLWGLTHDGQEGVELVVNILERELSRTMALAGAKDVASIDTRCLAVRKNDGFGVARL